MTYFASVTFDIKNGNSDDYQIVYAALAKIGFFTHITGGSGVPIQLPTTTCAGEFTAPSAVSARDDLTNRVEQIFLTNRLTGEVFVNVGGDWAWGYRKPKAKRAPTLHEMLAAMNR